MSARACYSQAVPAGDVAEVAPVDRDRVPRVQRVRRRTPHLGVASSRGCGVDVVTNGAGLCRLRNSFVPKPTRPAHTAPRLLTRRYGHAMSIRTRPHDTAVD